MMTTKERIEEIKREGYQLDFSTVFGNAFENYKKIALKMGLLFLLGMMMFAVLIVFIFVAFYGMKDATFFENFDPESMELQNLSLPFLIGYTIFAILITAILSPITAGLLQMARDASRNQEVSIGTAFDYYRKPFLKEIFVAMLILSFFSVTISTMTDFVGIKLLGVIISFLISFFTCLTIPFIIFGNLKAIDAIQASFTIVSKQILLIFGLMIVAILFASAGLIVCCIGIIFTMPIIYSLYYCIYDEAVGVYENEEVDEEFYIK